MGDWLNSLDVHELEKLTIKFEDKPLEGTGDDFDFEPLPIDTNMASHKNDLGSKIKRQTREKKELIIHLLHRFIISKLKKILNHFKRKKYSNYGAIENALIKEFYIFFCTKNRKYIKLRKKLNSMTGKSTKTIVDTISASLGIFVVKKTDNEYLGVITGVATDIVARSLLRYLEKGKNTFCSFVSENYLEF